MLIFNLLSRKPVNCIPGSLGTQRWRKTKTKSFLRQIFYNKINFLIKLAPRMTRCRKGRSWRQASTVWNWTRRSGKSRNDISYWPQWGQVPMDKYGETSKFSFQSSYTFKSHTNNCSRPTRPQCRGVVGFRKVVGPWNIAGFFWVQDKPKPTRIKTTQPNVILKEQYSANFLRGTKLYMCSQCLQESFLFWHNKICAFLWLNQKCCENETVALFITDLRSWQVIKLL